MSQLAIRFWKKVAKSGDDDCWNWTASTWSSGYGQLKRGKPIPGNEGAHRISYEMHHGAIPDGMLVCHTCDNRLCVNPKHLYAGDRLRNQGDMAERDRVAHGERQPMHKLTEKAVTEIRARYIPNVVSFQALADAYGVSVQCISNVVNRKSWRRVI